MAVLSMRGRKRVSDVVLTGLIIVWCWLLQSTILNGFTFQSSICNLPLTLTILWGFVFGTEVDPLTIDDLRHRSTAEVFMLQLLSGSVSGALVGAFVAALYSSVLPIYPWCYPLVGWMAGYISSRNFSRETLLCIPVVLLFSVLAEFITASQLWIAAQIELAPHLLQGGASQAWQFSGISQSQPFLRLAQIAFPESLLNALIAPFVYFPLSSWYDFHQSNQSAD